MIESKRRQSRHVHVRGAKAIGSGEVRVRGGRLLIGVECHIHDD